MGAPSVIFTTYAENEEGANLTTNVAGTHSYVELRSDLVPQSALFSNGDFTVTDFDIVRINTEVATQNSASNTQLTGTFHTNTEYNTRGVDTQGTFSIRGGQYELGSFDTGDPKASAIDDHMVKSGVSHNYVAFANTGDGKALQRTIFGTVIGAATEAVGPPTAFAPSKPFSNIEFNISHTTTPLQARAGGGFANGNFTADDFSGANMDGVFVSSTSKTGSEESGFTFFFNMENAGGRTGTRVIMRSYKEFFDTEFESDTGETVIRQESAVFQNNSNLILENYYPGAEYSPSTANAQIVHEGAIRFRVHPDSEYEMSTNMPTINVGVSSIVVSANAQTGPIATHARVLVTTSAAHGLTDNQNQIVLSGAESPTHINGLHNVHSVSNTTVFDYMIPFSVQGGTQTATGTFKLQTFDGIDKTGAVIKTGTSAAGIAEVVHGGCGGNNKVILRGDTSSNISLGTQYFAYSNNSSTSAIASVKFTSGPTYRSMFRDMGLLLNENTGQITSNGHFEGGVLSDEITTGGFITLEDNDSGKLFGTDFIIQETFDGKMKTEDFARTVTGARSGIRELDSFYPKFKHARDSALNLVKSDGTITQSGNTVTIVGVEGVSNIISLEDESGGILTESEAFTIGLEENTKTFPTKFANALPQNVLYKSLVYQNGFSVNVSSRDSNSEFTVQSNTTITLNEGTGDGESYQLTFQNNSFPTQNTSSFWFLEGVNNAPAVDSDANILLFKATSEALNFKVHFTIRAEKVHEHIGVYTGSQGTSTAASVLNSIDGWGDAFQLGTGNYKDGYFFVSVYNNTDSDRNDQIMVYSDQNNAVSNTLDFNGNSFKHRDDPANSATEINITNAQALTNSYSNGLFTVLTSV